MTQTNEQSVAERIASLEAEIAEKKIKLPPDIFKYVEDNILALQRISRERKMPTEKDMEFMEHVRMWLSLDEVYQEKFSNMELMLSEPYYKEAVKIGITISQYTACVEIAEYYASTPISSESVNRAFLTLFQFPGDKKVHSRIGEINILDYAGHLPDNWEVDGHLELSGFKGDYLSKNLRVRKNLNLSNCPNLKTIPHNFTVGHDLTLSNLPSLRTIGENLSVGGLLRLKDCDSLENLPNNATISGPIFLSNNSRKEIKDWIGHLFKNMQGQTSKGLIKYL